MTLPPSPLAYVLETITEVRAALAYVPRILAAGDAVYAREVVEEQRFQLSQLTLDWPVLEALGLPVQEQLQPLLDAVDAQAVSLSAIADALPPGGEPGNWTKSASNSTDKDFGDVPLWDS